MTLDAVKIFRCRQFAIALASVFAKSAQYGEVSELYFCPRTILRAAETDRHRFLGFGRETKFVASDKANRCRFPQAFF